MLQMGHTGFENGLKGNRKKINWKDGGTDRVGGNLPYERGKNVGGFGRVESKLQERKKGSRDRKGEN